MAEYHSSLMTTSALHVVSGSHPLPIVWYPSVIVHPSGLPPMPVPPDNCLFHTQMNPPFPSKIYLSQVPFLLRWPMHRKSGASWPGQLVKHREVKDYLWGLQGPALPEVRRGRSGQTKQPAGSLGCILPWALLYGVVCRWMCFEVVGWRGKRSLGGCLVLLSDVSCKHRAVPSGSYFFFTANFLFKSSLLCLLNI